MTPFLFYFCKECHNEDWNQIKEEKDVLKNFSLLPNYPLSFYIPISSLLPNYNSFWGLLNDCNVLPNYMYVIIILIFFFDIYELSYSHIYRWVYKIYDKYRCFRVECYVYMM